MGRLIALDAGHSMVTAGKRTPIFTDGTVSKLTGKNFMHEYEFNKAVVDRLDVILKRCGFRTLITAPNGNVDVPLATRTKMANDAKADAFISIHANAHLGTWGNARGIETFHFPNSTTGKRLADLVHKYLIQGTAQVNRGVKTANFHVLRETNMPSILVEAGFMDNLEEARLLLSDNYRDECAIEIAKGICEYFNVSYVAPAPPTPPPSTAPSNVLFRVQVGAFSVRANAENLRRQLEGLGYKPFIAQEGNLFRVQVGAFSIRANALNLQKELEGRGYKPFIVQTTR